MHRGLLVFSILLILAGFVTGTYFIPLIGVFLLFAAIITPAGSRGPAQGRIAVQSPPQQEPASYVMDTMRAPTETKYISATTEPVQPSGYERRTAEGSPALFPTTMFPSFMQPQPAMMPIEGGKREQTKPEPRDELVELAALLMIVRLVSA